MSAPASAPSSSTRSGREPAGTGLPVHVQTALSQTYVYALSNALYVAGGISLLGALLAWVLIAAHPGSGQAAEWAPAQEEPDVERSQATEPVHV